MPEIWIQHYHTIYYPKGCYLIFLYYDFFILKARSLSPHSPAFPLLAHSASSPDSFNNQRLY